ncbi:MAG: YdeI/OmpD-associated family protein [Undibacterium sp.]|nr:YdeI/OmpD-associated family protein [Opitutaceae bacterium]
MKPIFFKTPADFGKWLAKHGRLKTELLVGLHKLDSGRPSITWPQSVDEALCSGWIDGVRKRIDEFSYTVRFTPRKTTGIWSAINIARVQALTDLGRMQPGGLKAFAARVEHKSRIYSYEQKTGGLDPASEAKFKADGAAWTFFQAQPPGYRKLAAWRVSSAKQETTRTRRLAQLIATSAAGKRLL